MRISANSPPVYFDCAATAWPRPPAVTDAVQHALLYAGGNPGRGGHPLAERAAAAVFSARVHAAELFSAQPEHIVFTLNCTHALNLAIYGLLRPGDHVVISSMEHNAVYRPVSALAEAGVIRFSIAEVSPDPEETLRSFRAHIRPETRAVICTLVSNVTGLILPFRELAALCRAHGLILIADGAQACGILPVSLEDGMHLLCTAGHKGLLGPPGTGMLISDGSVPLRPLMQGGTGSQSASAQMPGHLPDALEPGTVNVPGIAGLDAGMQTVMRRGTEAVLRHETALCERLMRQLADDPDVTVFRTPGAAYAPVVSFTVRGESPNATAARLAAQGFCVRAGLHCAPLAHRTAGTLPEGTVRFAPGYANTAAETDAFAAALRRKTPRQTAL